MLRCSRAVKRARRTVYRQSFSPTLSRAGSTAGGSGEYDFAVPESWGFAVNLYRVTQAFRERGHFVADTNPLEKHISKLADEGIELRNFHRDSFESFLFHEKSGIETHQQSALSEVARNSADSTLETINLSAWDLGHVRKDQPLPRGLCAKLLSVNDASVETPNT